MSQKSITFLGTASQLPTRERNHNSAFLQWGSDGILIDAGEGTQRQMTHAGISAGKINRILITHFHGDHCLGLPGVIQRFSADQVQHAIAIHYPVSGQAFFDRLRYASAYMESAQIIPCPIEGAGLIYETDEYEITAHAMDHTVDCFAYRVCDKPRHQFLKNRLDEYGIQGAEIGRLQKEGRIEKEGREILLEQVTVEKAGLAYAHVTDTGLCDAAVEAAWQADLMVCESTYLNDADRKNPEIKHLTAGEAGEIAAKAGARKLALTHFSGRYSDTEPFTQEARSVYGGEVVTVRDGDRIPIGG